MSTSNQPAAYAVAKINNVDLLVIEENGLKLVPIAPICDIIGIVSNGQIEKIKRHPILFPVGRVTRSTGADGKQYEMFCIPLKYVFGWLFTIHPDRVAPEARDAVIRYHMECYDALYNHFVRYYEYVEFRDQLAEKHFDVVEKLREEFRTAKDRLDVAKSDFARARQLTYTDYLANKDQLILPFAEPEPEGGES